MNYQPTDIAIYANGGDLTITFRPPANSQFRYGLAIRNFGETYTSLISDGHLSPIDHANDIYTGISPLKLVGGNALIGFEMYKIGEGRRGMEVDIGQGGQNTRVTVSVEDDEEAEYAKVMLNFVARGAA